ncbi:MAG: extracellular solute-binding protein [Dorea sp.]|jgi:putative aldouronate transport system substrate-binding protein|nr:extracellular solute-binding protein [Dorea sp.]
MMKKKKIISVFLLGALAVSGCIFKNDGEDQEEPVRLTSVLEYGAIDEEIPEGTTPENNSFNRTAKERLNIEIEWLWSAAEEQYRQKLNVAVATGNMPDFMAVREGTAYRRMVEGNQIMPWNEVLEGAGETLKEWIYRNPQVLEAVTNENGEIMALPQYWDTKRQVNIMMIRKDWLYELGLGVPETIDEFEKVAKAFQEKTGASQGIFLTHKALGRSVGSMSGLLHMSGSYPGAWIEQDGELFPGEISEKTKEGLAVLNRFYEEGILDEEFPLCDYNKLRQEVLEERLGIVIAPFWEFDSLIGREIAKNQDSRWITAPIPVAKGTKGAVMDTVSIEKYWVINRNCENPEAVMDLFNLFVELETDYPKEARAENGFIWEWTAAHYFDPYDIDEMYEAFHGRIDAGDLVSPPDVSNRLLSYWEDCEDYYRWKEGGGSYSPDNEWGIFLARVDEDGAWATVRNLVREGKYELNRYYGLPTDVMNARKDILDKMTEETFTKMVMGELPIEQFDEYRRKWMELGGEELIEEVNAWSRNNQ